MQDKTLLRIALLGSILGILILAILIQFLRLEETRIPDVKADGKTIALKGIVTDIKARTGTTILTLTQQCEIPVVIFDELHISKGDHVRIIGSSQEYRGQPEIIAETIERYD